MDKIIFKNCVVCIAEKSFDNFYIKSGECKQCNNKRVLKRYYDNEEKIVQQRRDKCARLKDLEKREKALKN